MEIINQHPWPDDKRDAYAIRDIVREKIIISPITKDPETIVSVNTAHGFGGRYIYCAAISMTYPDLKVINKSFANCEAIFPFDPSLFFFREGRAIIESMHLLDADPDLILVGGHGIAHPRQCGMACHVGVTFDKPTIGCARKLLAGEYDPLDMERGETQPLYIENEKAGYALRSKDGTKPMFVSPGHKCDIDYAIKFILSNLTDYRFPEPMRIAHVQSNKYKRSLEKKQRD